MSKLSPLKIEKLRREAKPGTHHDGDGLYLRIRQTGAPAWFFRYTPPRGGKPRDMGLGQYPTLGPAAARKQREANAKLVADGIDPIDQRKTERSQALTAAAEPQTVWELAQSFFEWKVWKGEWGASRQHQFPSRIQNIPMAMRSTRVADFTPALAEGLLKRTWKDKPQLSKDLHSILHQMFERAIDLKIRPDNPFARVKRALGQLPESGENAAYPFREMPELMAKVRAFHKKPPFRTDIDRKAILDAYAAGVGCRRLSREFNLPYATVQKISRSGTVEYVHAAMVKRAAFELMILLALRQENVIGMQWRWLNLTVPGEEMLMIPREEMKITRGHKGRPYETPLPKRAVEIISWVKDATASVSSSFVFPGLDQGREPQFRKQFAAEHPDVTGYPMGAVSLWHFAKQHFDLEHVTLHGFRSSFTDWAEENDYEERLIKLQLDHVRGNVVDRAYARGSLFRARRLMLEHWSSFLAGGSADVIPLNRKVSA